ncbi:MAG: Acylphosphatase [Pseudomonadota bacterium]
MRNLWDGRVEVLVALNLENEKEFLELLQKGPKFSEVADLQIQNVSGPIVLESFQIKEDGRTLYAI